MDAPRLTFDDGPSDRPRRALDLLRDDGIRATFFVIGFRAEQRTDLVKRAHDEGQIIGNHTWDHVALRSSLKDAKGARTTLSDASRSSS